MADAPSSHARAANLWILRSDVGGDLEIAETIPLGEEIQPDDPDDSDFLNYQNGVYYLDVTPIASELTSGVDDIVTVHRNSGAVDIRRATAGGRSFDRTVSQQLFIPGRPRAAKLVDLYGDNWNDLVVVVRNHDHVLLFDEDDLQRRLASMQLQNLGCVFHAAESHERALQIFEADPLIRLVLVDYGKDGTGLGELVWKIRKARETTTIVGISSGFRRREFEEIGIDRCLQKPLVSDTIRELLENCRTRA